MSLCTEAVSHELVNSTNTPRLFAVPQVSNTGFLVDCLKHPLVCPGGLNKDHDPFEEMKKRQMEEGDYLLVRPMKTGQHWMWEIMNMLIAGKAQYVKTDKDFSWLEGTPLDAIQERYAKPRVLCSHLALSWLPEGFR